MGGTRLRDSPPHYTCRRQSSKTAPLLISIGGGGMPQDMHTHARRTRTIRRALCERRRATRSAPLYERAARQTARREVTPLVHSHISTHTIPTVCTVPTRVNKGGRVGVDGEGGQTGRKDGRPADKSAISAFRQLICMRRSISFVAQFHHGGGFIAGVKPPSPWAHAVVACLHTRCGTQTLWIHAHAGRMQHTRCETQTLWIML